jgi:hypothetical protein
MAGSHGVTRVQIVHNPRTEDETVIGAHALIQAKSGFLEIDTPGPQPPSRSRAAASRSRRSARRARDRGVLARRIAAAGALGGIALSRLGKDLLDLRQRLVRLLRRPRAGITFKGIAAHGWRLRGVAGRLR